MNDTQETVTSAHPRPKIAWWNRQGTSILYPVTWHLRAPRFCPRVCPVIVLLMWPFLPFAEKNCKRKSLIRNFSLSFTDRNASFQDDRLEHTQKNPENNKPWNRVYNWTIRLSMCSTPWLTLFPWKNPEWFVILCKLINPRVDSLLTNPSSINQPDQPKKRGFLDDDD